MHHQVLDDDVVDGGAVGLAWHEEPQALLLEAGPVDAVHPRT